MGMPSCERKRFKVSQSAPFLRDGESDELTGLLDLFLPQPNCRRVFLGGWAPPARWRPTPEEFKARSTSPKKPMPYDKIVLLQQAGADSQSFACIDKSFGPEHVLCFNRTEIPYVFRPINTPKLRPAFDYKSRVKAFVFADEDSDSSSSYSTPHGSPTGSLLSWTEVPSPSPSSPTTTVSTSSPMASPKTPSRPRQARTRSSSSAKSLPSTPTKKHVPGMAEYETPLYSAAVKPKPVSYEVYLADVARNPKLARESRLPPSASVA